MKKIAIRLLVLLVFAGVAALGYYLVQNVPKSGDGDLTLAEVKRGDLTVRSFMRGELRAVRSLTLAAPNLGSQTQITQLAPAGALAHRGDLIFELDDSERVAALEDSMLSVERIQEELKKAETELEIRKLQDDVELVRADFQVRRAELQMRRNELISAIDARKNELTLEEATRRKAKLEEDIKNRLAQREAELAVLREQLAKAELDAERERRRIAQARVLSPITGLVQILENRSGGRGGFGTTTPAVREGDQVPAGLAVAQLLDLSEMELVTKVEETERANLREGQEAFVRLDALPGKIISARIKRLGTTASMNIFRGEATKKFDCILSIDMEQLLASVGASPEQVRRIMATAKENAEQGYGAAAGRGAGAGPGQGRAGGGAPRMGIQRPDGPDGAPAQARQRPQGAPGGGAEGQGEGGGQRPQIPAEAREKLQELLGGRNFAELSDEERQKLRQEMARFRPSAGEGGGAGPGQGRAGGGRPDGSPAVGGPAAAAGAPLDAVMPAAAGGFSEAQRRNAQLPSPPAAGSDVDVLLRPGLLADAEIIVESIPDVLYVPFHAVVETARGPVVYVWNGRALEARPVELGARTESQIAILNGLEEGERISLELPEAQRGGPKKKPGQKPGGKTGEGSGPALPGGRGGV